MSKLQLVRWDEKNGQRKYQFTKDKRKIGEKRYGFHFKCTGCGQRYNVGGEPNLKRFNTAFLALESVHEKCGGNCIITKSYHATEIAHAYAEDTTNRTTTSTTFQNGATILATNLVANATYIIVATADLSGSDNKESVRCRLNHGSTTFSHSTMIREVPVAADSDRLSYFFVQKHVQGGTAELYKIQYSIGNAGDICRIDQQTLMAMRLDVDLTEDTDWWWDEVTADTAVGTSVSTTNNASETFTPSETENYAFFFSQTVDVLDNKSSLRSVINVSGTPSVSNQNVEVLEGEDSDEELFISTNLYLAAQTATACTATQKVSAGSAGDFTRKMSRLFILRLGIFKANSIAFSIGAEAMNAANWSTNQNFLMNTEATLDVWLMASIVGDNSIELGFNHRLRINGIEQPPTQTADQYDFGFGNDGVDQLAHSIQSVESVTTGAKSYVHEWNRVGVAIDSRHRALFAMTFELSDVVSVRTLFQTMVNQSAMI